MNIRLAQTVSQPLEKSGNHCLGGTVYIIGLATAMTVDLTIKPGQVDSPMTVDFQKGLLWAKPQRIAADIIKGIDKRKNVVYTPWFWQIIMLIIRSIPEKIFKKMRL